MLTIFQIVLWATLSLNLPNGQPVLSGIKWNRRLKDFEPLPGASSYEIERRALELLSRQEELHNFNGEPLHLTYYQELGFFEFYDNDTKASGICGDMWNILAKLLNFTLVVTRSEMTSLGVTFENGSYDGVLEYARLNQTDIIPKMEVHNSRIKAVRFTPGVWSNSFRIFIHGQSRRNQTWLFNLFTDEVWSLIIVFILSLSFSSFVMQMVLMHKVGLKLRPLSYVGHLLYTFASVCNEGNVPNNGAVASKILMLITAVFSGFILTGYSSRLLYNMTLEVLAAPFNDLVTLLEKTKLHVVVLNGTMGYMMFTNLHAKIIFTRIKRAKRFVIVSNLTDLYDKVCSHSHKYVLFDGMDEVAVRGTAVCTLFPVGMRYYPTTIASGISGRVKYKRSLDIGLAKLREFGIIDRIRNSYMASSNRVSSVEQSGIVSIDMHHIIVILELFGIGLILSLVICAVEMAIFALRRRERNRRFVRPFSANK